MSRNGGRNWCGAFLFLGVFLAGMAMGKVIPAWERVAVPAPVLGMDAGRIRTADPGAEAGCPEVVMYAGECVLLRVERADASVPPDAGRRRAPSRVRMVGSDSDGGAVRGRGY